LYQKAISFVAIAALKPFFSYFSRFGIGAETDVRLILIVRAIITCLLLLH